MFQKANKVYLLLLSTVVVLILVFSLQNVTKTKDKVAATIYPLYDITRNIAGKEIETVLLLEPGASPHTFDPTPKEIKNLSNSKIIFAIGNGLDDWSLKIAKSAEVERIVNVDTSIKLLDSEEGANPHYWLSPKNALIIADNIKNELIQEFPSHKDTIEANYKSYEANLNRLDSEIKTKLDGLQNKKFATFHNAWDYLAQDYNLEITTTFEEFPGREPTSQYLSEFSDKIKSNNVKVVFAEPQFSTAPLLPVAADLGITISFLDPIGGTPGRETYTDLMNYNVRQIVSQLQ